jgi:serine/threonine-protein kinase
MSKSKRSAGNGHLKQLHNGEPPFQNRMHMRPQTIRPRQRIGKYRIERKMAEGGFANVYAAMDTIEGVRVAVKIPFDKFVSSDLFQAFRQEVRLVAKLDHPNVLPLKDASMIEGRFVIVSLLGQQTLDERLAKRVSMAKAIDYAEQLIEAVAYAHEHGIIHCDIKPDNIIVFPGDHLRLADFGIAKVTRKTVQGSGTGTIGHMAPEQAMGKPSFRSDVFSLGLILYRLFSGHWPEYPFDWPPPGAFLLRRKKLHPDMIEFIKRAIAPRPNDRFKDAVRMRREFQRLKAKVLRHLRAQSR